MAGAVLGESSSDGGSLALSLDDEDSTLNAAPFEYSEDSPLGDVLDSAARAVSEPDEAHCFAQYERDLDMCNALYTAMGGSRGAILCRQNAFDRHQQCRGF
ncbi:hypothetical protein AWB72_01892 [Caballeronia concitans]|uniref:Uncharacterized protein n=2 Tax=Caballeronia concitans TaxID=1777133 RepID=A0A658QV60_9BURK|nr:hypothetical protein BurMR1_3127 [Burkholderia sp. MR1]SAL24556.1 hypothetical protein AWB72_01892 [Caballeronia concitans]